MIQNGKLKNSRQMVAKGFTVRPPWARLIMDGKKDVENRSRPTKYRGRVAVHASSTLRPADKVNAKKHKLDVDKLPVGVVIGTVELYDCVRTPGASGRTGEAGIGC